VPTCLFPRARMSQLRSRRIFFFFFQAEDGIRDRNVTGVQTCALPIYCLGRRSRGHPPTPKYLKKFSKFHQIGDEMTGFLAILALILPAPPLLSFACASSSVIDDFHRLHARCMTVQLLLSYDEPPRERGRISSTTADRGSRCGKSLSKGSPHSADASSSASTRARTCGRRRPLALTFGRLRPPVHVCGPPASAWVAG